MVRQNKSSPKRTGVRTNSSGISNSFSDPFSVHHSELNSPCSDWNKCIYNYGRIINKCTDHEQFKVVALQSKGFVQIWRWKSSQIVRELFWTYSWSSSVRGCVLTPGQLFDFDKPRRGACHLHLYGVLGSTTSRCRKQLFGYLLAGPSFLSTKTRLHARMQARPATFTLLDDLR